MLLPLQGAGTLLCENPGCRFACPGLCATLGFQPALVKSETSVFYHSQIKTDRLKHVFSLSVLMFYRVYLFSKKLLRSSTHLLLIVLHTELEGRS